MNTPFFSIPTVSIIIPTFRESENLPLIIPQLASVLRARGWRWEVIVVDDNSPDSTPEILENLQRQIPELHYKIRTHERGLSSAVLTGMSLAHHDYLVVMDADLSHPPETVPLLVEKLLRDEADFALGSRYVPGGKTEDWTAFRWLNSYIATLLAKPLVGTVKDPMSGFFAIRRESLIQADPLSPIGYKIALELMVKCRIRRVAEVPITFRNRQHGQSKLTMKEQFSYLEHLSRLFDYKFPQGSPRSKFLIAAACGSLACLSTLYTLEFVTNLGFAINFALSLIAMILVTLAFFIRYVRTQHDFLVMRHPYSEFTYISLAELLVGWFFAVSTVSPNSTPAFVRASVGIGVLLLVRYALRKVFLHDIRGIRGQPRPAANFQFTFASKSISKSAASA